MISSSASLACTTRCFCPVLWLRGQHYYRPFRSSSASYGVFDSWIGVLFLMTTPPSTPSPPPPPLTNSRPDPRYYSPVRSQVTTLPVQGQFPNWPDGRQSSLCGAISGCLKVPLCTPEVTLHPVWSSSPAQMHRNTANSQYNNDVVLPIIPAANF